jgi:hypothetical protein
VGVFSGVIGSETRHHPLFMKTMLTHLTVALVGLATFSLSSCAYHARSYASSTAATGGASPPLQSAVAQQTQNAKAGFFFGNRILTGNTSATFPQRRSLFGSYYTQPTARPYYSNYGWGRPYYGSSWYAYPYTSQWHQPGYSRYYGYGPATTCYGTPMSHYGGWSYTQRPVLWPTSTGYHRYWW